MLNIIDRTIPKAKFKDRIEILLKLLGSNRNKNEIQGLQYFTVTNHFCGLKSGRYEIKTLADCRRDG